MYGQRRRGPLHIGRDNRQARRADPEDCAQGRHR
jgi:hypothetical protein